MAVPSFLIDTSAGETPQSVAKKRAIIQQLMMPYGRASNIGEGVGQLFNGIAVGMQGRKLDKAESAGQASGSTAKANILRALTGSAPIGEGPFPAAPKAPVNQYKADGSMAGKIAETAQALGIDPIDLGTAISYETGGTFDPTKKGPTTQWGQHRGLIQFGEPQAKKYGVDWNDPVGSQLGPDGAVAKYLRDTGVKPGMGMMDIYSAINAGGVGRYNASDANNGGAPGTVADKVNQQMSGHRAKAMKIMEALQGGQQVASLDPSVGMPQQRYVGQVNPNGSIGTATQTMQPQMAPQPQQVAQAAPQAPQGQGMAIQDAGTPFERMAPQQGGMNLEMLIQQAQNPWLDEQSKAMVNSMIEREMQKQDPAYQMQQQQAQIGLQKSQLELQQLMNPPAPQPKFENVGGRLVKINPDGTVSEAYAPPAEQKLAEPTSEQKNYEFAVKQLRDRGVPDDKLPTFQEWSKPKSRGISFTGPDGTKIQIGGEGDGAPNLDGTSIPAEVGARIGLGQSFIQEDYPAIIKMIEGGDATGPIDWAAGKFGRGNSGIVQRRMASGVDALRRGLTGAGMSMSETEEYASRYSPQLTDTPETLKLKAEGLKRDLEAVSSGAINGKAGNISGLMPGVGTPSAATAALPDLSKMSDAELEALINGQ